MLGMDSTEACDVPCSSGLSSSGIVAPAPVRKRRFSSAKIQPTRVKKVMQSDEEIGRMVASVPVAIGRAMEHFAEKLLETAAQCVQCSSSRTLSPSHMKQAVMQYRYFTFLKPLMREVSLPTRVTNEFAWNSEAVPQPVLPFFLPGQMSDIALQLNRTTDNIPYINSIPLPPSIPPAAICGKRRPSNGISEISNDVKPKRGRPRKIRKEEKCVDADEIIGDVNQLVCEKNVNGANRLSTLSDSELMPPPALPPPRFCAVGVEGSRNATSTAVTSQTPIFHSPPALQSIPLNFPASFPQGSPSNGTGQLN